MSPIQNTKPLRTPKYTPKHTRNPPPKPKYRKNTRNICDLRLFFCISVLEGNFGCISKCILGFGGVLYFVWGTQQLPAIKKSRPAGVLRNAVICDVMTCRGILRWVCTIVPLIGEIWMAVGGNDMNVASATKEANPVTWKPHASLRFCNPTEVAKRTAITKHQQKHRTVFGIWQVDPQQHATKFFNVVPTWYH